jgi:hypothetical protein
MAAPAVPSATTRLRGTHRLIASRWPTVGIFDAVASPDDLREVIDLESWTNDRLQAEVGVLHRVPPEHWVTGVPNASVVMAAFCHPSPDGGRFTDATLGAWYAAEALETAHREVAYRRWLELAEIGVTETRLEMRQYRADLQGVFHDVRNRRRFAALHDPDSWAESQRVGAALRESGSHGIRYDSVRHPGHACAVAFWPDVVRNVRQGAHFEYVFAGSPTPRIREIGRS